MREETYVNTFIAVADDCTAAYGREPKTRESSPTIARLQYDLLRQPYRYSQSDILFEVYAVRGNIPKSQRAAMRQKFFSKGQPCLRCSPLGKTYGWGIHFNAEGKAAIYGVETTMYRTLSQDASLKHTKAMKSKR